MADTKTLTEPPLFSSRLLLHFWHTQRWSMCVGVCVPASMNTFCTWEACVNLTVVVCFRKRRVSIHIFTVTQPWVCVCFHILTGGEKPWHAGQTQKQSAEVVGTYTHTQLYYHLGYDIGANGDPHRHWTWSISVERAENGLPSLKLEQAFTSQCMGQKWSVCNPLKGVLMLGFQLVDTPCCCKDTTASTVSCMGCSIRKLSIWSHNIPKHNCQPYFP